MQIPNNRYYIRTIQEDNGDWSYDIMDGHTNKVYAFICYEEGEPNSGLLCALDECNVYNKQWEEQQEQDAYDIDSNIVGADWDSEQDYGVPRPRR